MKFTDAKIKSVKADLAKGEITISFSVDLEQNQEDAEELAECADKKAGSVEIEINPRQMKLKMEIKKEDPVSKTAEISVTREP